MPKFKNLLPLLTSFPLTLSIAKTNKIVPKNEEAVTPYESCIITNYVPSSYVKFFELNVSMNNYVDAEEGKLFVPFCKLDKTVNLGYEFYYINQEGTKYVFSSGEHSKEESASLPESGLYSFTGYFPIKHMGERATFTLRFYDKDARYLDHFISFKLTQPGVVYHVGRYARIFFQVILYNNKLYNYEDRIDFGLTANQYICDYYIKIPFNGFKFKFWSTKTTVCDIAYFLLYDSYGYLEPLMGDLPDGSGYSYIDINLEQVDSTSTYEMSISETFYLNQDTFLSDFVRSDDKEIEVNDIYLPIQKYDYYQEISCGIYLANVGRSKTTIYHTFSLIFENRYIYSTIVTSRKPGGSPYKTTMTEHFIWTRH